MTKDNVIALKSPESSLTEFAADILTELARQGVPPTRNDTPSHLILG